MDPNAALTAILRGHLIAQHADALQAWLACGGFCPDAQRMPDHPHTLFAEHCERTYGCRRGVAVAVKANETGIWTQGAADRAVGNWWLCADWDRLTSQLDF
jgi:hypothetical protein